ncbi:MAG: hypothetical protein H6842_04755 [Rhodospirillaceae bacterium]|nr:hypothetical protein [Rhodospirillaceae bacterium]
MWAVAAPLAGALSVLAACTPPANPQAMVAVPQGTIGAMDPALLRAVSVSAVSGVEGTDSLWMSELAATAFQDALNQSLAAQQLLADTPAAARYALNAQILEVSQPRVGFDMTAETRISYVLSDLATGQQPFAETISSEGTASFGDDLNGDERRRLATEAAVRSNIRQFLERLASVRVP